MGRAVSGTTVITGSNYWMMNRRGGRKEVGQEEDHRIAAFPLRVGCTVQYWGLDSVHFQFARIPRNVWP
jgi:hypothetical protein